MAKQNPIHLTQTMPDLALCMYHSLKHSTLQLSAIFISCQYSHANDMIYGKSK